MASYGVSTVGSPRPLNDVYGSTRNPVTVLKATSS
jgi:hypothetical protein